MAHLVVHQDMVESTFSTTIRLKLAIIAHIVLKVATAVIVSIRVRLLETETGEVLVGCDGVLRPFDTP